jgi:hypothetical protein
MILTSSLLLFLIFLSISSLHFYWGFGGKWGNSAVIPTKDDSIKVLMPGLLATITVAFGLLTFGVFVLIKSEIIDFKLPLWLDRSGLLVISGIFLIRAIGDFKYVGFFKKIKQTKFGQNDTKYYTPLCLLIFILAMIIEFGL